MTIDGCLLRQAGDQDTGGRVRNGFRVMFEPGGKQNRNYDRSTGGIDPLLVR